MIKRVGLTVKNIGCRGIYEASHIRIPARAPP